MSDHRALHEDRTCKYCGWRTKFYGVGNGRDRDGYRCMRYVDNKMWKKDSGQLDMFGKNTPQREEAV